MISKAWSLTLLAMLVLTAYCEIPSSVSVGYKDGGFIGFQTNMKKTSKLPSSTYLLASTSSGAFVLNANPTDTIAEVTLLENSLGSNAMLEEFDEFGVQTIDETLTSVALGPKRKFPLASKPTGPTQIPLAEAALRVPTLNVSKLLNIREHSHRIDPNLHVAAGGTLSVSNSQQWTLVHLDDFDQSAAGWFISKNGTLTTSSVNDRRQSCENGVDKHLGGYCEFSREEVSKTFAGLPPHSMIQITARFHFFDYWLGEYAYAKVNGKPVWMHAHAFCSKPFAEYCKGVNACGDNKFADKLSHLVKIIIPHTEDSVTVTFGSSLDGSPCKASWAVDDVAVYTKF